MNLKEMSRKELEELRNKYYDPRDVWPEFSKLIAARLRKGHAKFGNKMVRRPHVELIDEAIEEMADIFGWMVPFFGWMKREQIDMYLKDMNRMKSGKAHTLENTVPGDEGKHGPTKEPIVKGAYAKALMKKK